MPGAMWTSTLLKKTHMLRCARSSRFNVPQRVRLRSSILRVPRLWDLFEQPANSLSFILAWMKESIIQERRISLALDPGFITPSLQYSSQGGDLYESIATTLLELSRRKT